MNNIIILVKRERDTDRQLNLTVTVWVCCVQIWALIEKKILVGMEGLIALLATLALGSTLRLLLNLMNIVDFTRSRCAHRKLSLKISFQPIASQKNTSYPSLGFKIDDNTKQPLFNK